MDLEEASDLLDDIDNDGRGLTNWEIDFLDAMLKQLDDDVEPTDAQAEKIRQIHKDRC